jgi:hypothetical protein
MTNSHRVRVRGHSRSSVVTGPDSRLDVLGSSPAHPTEWYTGEELKLVVLEPGWGAQTPPWAPDMWLVAQRSTLPKQTPGTKSWVRIIPTKLYRKATLHCWSALRLTRTAPHRPQTIATIVGKNAIYNREHLIVPFLVHKILVPRVPSSLLGLA